MSLPPDYDEVRKIIMKNLKISYWQFGDDSVKQVYPAEHIKRLHREITISPDILNSLEEYFRGKFNDHQEDKA